MTYYQTKFCAVLCLLICIGGQAGATAVGKGSYADTLPTTLTSPPADQYITTNITGPVPTTKWYSSLISSEYSYYHFANPLAMNAVSTGLQIGYPAVTAAADSITAPFVQDLEIGGDISGRELTVAANTGVLVEAYSDWTVSPLWTDATDKTKTISATYGHGLPFVYLTYSSGCDPKIIFSGAITAFDSNGNTLSDGTVNTNHIGVKYGSSYYGLFAPTSSSFTISGTTISITMPAASRYFSVALMTKDSGETDKQVLAYYYQYAYAFVTNSQVSWSYDETTQQVTNTFALTTVAQEGTETKTLMALLPHQYKNSTAAVSATRYYTVLPGKMKILAGTGFATVNTFHGVLPFLPDKGSYDKTHLAALLAKDKNSSLSKTDTYFNGKQVAKIANLIPIAEQLQDTATRNYLVSRLKTILVNWFTYTAGETTRFFYYDQVWSGLVGYAAEFYGYNYTDHHYHYGYLVYAAAILSMYDSSFKDDYGPMVEYLIRDYANWNRNDTMFPFMRHFDHYLGHSYCDGLAQSEKGNNQESSSEAMNSWAALILWGMVTNNDTIRDTGIYGYTTEYSGIRDYYFNMDQDIYSATYNHPLVGILHDDRILYDTWWDHVNDECVYGIQMIPATASMLYLGYNADYVKRIYDAFLVDNGAPEHFNGWYNIIWQFQAMADPEAVINKYRETVTIDSDGDTYSFLYHWIYNFKELGQVDTSGYADTPYHSVFSKDGTKTYVAYNPGTAEQKITFYGFGSQGSIYVQPQTLVAVQTFACEVISVSPDSCNNLGRQTLTIEGAGFQPGAQVLLLRSGQDNMTAESVNMISTAKITAEFDLTGVAPGNWSLVVINPGGNLTTARNMPITITSYLLTVSAISPSLANSRKQVRVQVTGTNFYNGSQIKLSRTGEPDIVATEHSYDSATQISGLLDIRNKTPGFWDVVVTNSDTQSGVFYNGFEIVQDNSFYVYPNPCKLNQDRKVYFINVSSDAVLKIYDLNGDEVFSASDITDNPFSWDLENILGRRIASGIYLYVIKDGGTLRKGKIAVIK